MFFVITGLENAIVVWKSFHHVIIMSSCHFSVSLSRVEKRSSYSFRTFVLE